MALVGFCGSRSLPVSSAPLIASVVGSVLASGRGVAVGCAAGADAVVRAAAPGCQVYSVSAFPSLPARAALAARSAACVSAVAASGPGAAVVGFVVAPCPVGLVPSRSPSRCFAGFGSGSWASLAFAAGLGLPVLVFSAGGAAGLPGSWGAWVSAAPAGVWSGGWRLVPAAAQAPLV